MLPMSGGGEPMAGAPGDAGCLPPLPPVVPLAPARAGAPDWGAVAFEAVADPAFARGLPALPWPAVVDGCDDCWPAAASANKQRMAAAAAQRRSIIGPLPLAAAARRGRARPEAAAATRGAPDSRSPGPAR